MQDGSLNLKTNEDGGAIILRGSNNGYSADISGSKGSLTLGDGTKKTDVYVDGYVKVTDGATTTFAENTITHVDSQYLTNDAQAFITTKEDDKEVGKVAVNGNLDIGNVKVGTKLNFSDSADVSTAAADKIITDNVL